MTIETLSQYALLKISGADAASFLQGQLSNDIRLLEPVNRPMTSGAEPAAAVQATGSKWQLSGYCNPKGRLLAIFYLWRQADDFFALLSSDLAEPVQKRLSMFVMRSKVHIQHLPDASTLGVLNLSDLAAAELSHAGIDRAAHGDALTTNESSTLLINRRYLLVKHANVASLKGEEYSSGENWARADIEEGIPGVCAATTEMFIPQMLNLDLLDGINFKKGCYTGQEIVARMHYLGKLKQRMFGVTMHADGATVKDTKHLPGDKIYADRELGKAVGNLVSIVGNQALAVLRLEYTAQTLYLDANTKLQVNVIQARQLSEWSSTNAR